MPITRAPPLPPHNQAPYTTGARFDHPSPAVAFSSMGPPPTPPPNQLAHPPPADPLRDPKPLLGCKLQSTVYEYKHFPRSAQHCAAALHVLDSFGNAMYNTKQSWMTKTLRKARLCDFAGLVTFTFAMCGIASAPPEPSIVVSCPNKLLRRVERELQSRHMKNQYAVGVTSGPAFTLYYCGRDDPAFRLRWCKSTASLTGPEQSLSLCGTRISSARHTRSPHSGEATIACLLEIKGYLYALGPAHLFTEKSAAKSQEQLLAELLQMDEDDDDDDIAFENHDDESDEDYVSTNRITSEQDTINSNTTLPSGPFPPLSKVVDNSSNDEGALEDLTIIYPGPEDLHKDHTDGDWAVTHIEKHHQQLPNLYLPEGQQASRLRHIVDVSSEPSGDDTQLMSERYVHILTSSSTKHGMLLPGFANISGLSGRGHCNVHIVSMTGSDGNYIPHVMFV